MIHLGFHHQEPKKGIYVDGHEREDVVEYRRIFVSRMLEHRKRMRMFVGVNCEEVIPPEDQLVRPIAIGRTSDIAIGSEAIAIAHKPELVLISHDESVFSSHDGRRMVWMEDGKPPLRPKGDGQGLMVSEFLCPCHGRMKTEDGRVASETMYFDAAGESEYQTFRKKMTDGSLIQKGLRSILIERGLWTEGMNTQDAKKLLNNQPDFYDQKPRLMEIIDAAGHLGIFLP